MKRVIFTGFFGITNKQASHYTKMWNGLGYNVDYEPYNIMDVLLFKKKYINRKIIPKVQHYDVVYSISGGCFHMSNILLANKHITYDKVIFDSGPYSYNTKHLEHYVNEKYLFKYKLNHIPVDTIINKFYQFRKIDLALYNKNYNDNFISTSKPTLLLTYKNDNIIVKPYIDQLVLSNTHHYEFEKGEHANLYRTNPQLYIDIIKKFVC